MISFETYRKFTDTYRRIPLLTSIPLQNPADWYAAVSDRGQAEGAVLLESSRTAPNHGRYSFVLYNPSAMFRSKGKMIRYVRNGQTHISNGDAFAKIEKILSENRAARYPGLPPFTGGAAGALSYECKNLIEKNRNNPDDPYAIPDITLGWYDWVIFIDHFKNKAGLIYSSNLHKNHRPKSAYNLSSSRLLKEAERLKALRIQTFPPAGFSMGKEHRQVSRQKFIRMVNKAKSHIRIGDIFQANLSHCLQFEFEGNPWDLYLKQSKINPTSFSAFCSFADYKLASASPERLVRSDGKTVSTRPIAGTRPRSGSKTTDLKLRRELKLSPKERAEHIMLLDLERNDLGRVCRFGSVQVDELMTIEEYSHVRHIVSNVTGRIRNSVRPTDIIRAVFPGGTITGAPKVRAMEIIDDIEKQCRGVYTGSVGYISFCGRMDWNIVIRSMLFINNKGFLQVGAGIVADSDASSEYDETIHKATSFLQMLRH